MQSVAFVFVTLALANTFSSKLFVSALAGAFEAIP